MSLVIVALVAALSALFIPDTTSPSICKIRPSLVGVSTDEAEKVDGDYQIDFGQIVFGDKIDNSSTGKKTTVEQSRPHQCVPKYSSVRPIISHFSYGSSAYELGEMQRLNREQEKKEMRNRYAEISANLAIQIYESQFVTYRKVKIFSATATEKTINEWLATASDSRIIGTAFSAGSRIVYPYEEKVRKPQVENTEVEEK